NGAKIQFTGGAGNNFIEGNVNNSGRIGIITDNTERITITLAGNVGIGNTLPVSKLTVAGAGTFSGDITATSGTFTLRPDVSGDSVATQSQIDSVQTQIDAVEGSDVDDVNSLIGSITVVGKGEVGVTVEGQNIVVSGTDHATDTDTVSDAMVGTDGITVLSGTPTASETTISGFRDEFLSASGTFLKNVVEDLTPQLGGDLDANGKDILIADGNASNPSIRFASDLDTGITNLGSDAILFVTGGESPVIFTSTFLFLLPQIVSNPGSATAPQFSFQSSADTGMYLPSVGELAFTTGGVPAARFDSSQNLHANADVIVSGTVTAPTGTFADSLTVSGIPVSLSDVEGITDIVQDLTPQLGGDLDVNGKSITSAGNTDINIRPAGTGGIELFTGDKSGDAGSREIWLATSGAGQIVLDTISDSNTGDIFIQAGGDLDLETFNAGKLDI
ncbi:hypothetical protein LCGC14_2661400, partial [marine sediment metagenome]